MCYQYQYHNTWTRPIPEIFWERVRTLLALSATCRAMRQVVLMMAWENLIMCRMNQKLAQWIMGGLLARCRILLGYPHLAPHVRYDSPLLHLAYF